MNDLEAKDWGHIKVKFKFLIENSFSTPILERAGRFGNEFKVDIEFKVKVISRSTTNFWSRQDLINALWKKGIKNDAKNLVRISPLMYGVLHYQLKLNIPNQQSTPTGTD